MKLIYKPTVRVLSRPTLDVESLMGFITKSFGDEIADSCFARMQGTDGDLLPEIAGRVCYMSFEKPRPGGNKTYLDHIKEVGHGSVLEHPSWSFIIEGVSRSLSHELVRHRAGIAISQLSQRYVDESDVAFVVPPAMARAVESLQRYRGEHTESGCPDSWFVGEASKLDLTASQAATAVHWEKSCNTALEKYSDLVRLLTADAPSELTGTDRRKWARQAARSVLPNCTETKMVWSANARALRHCIEMRAAAAADVEIRALFIEVLKTMQTEAPNLFGDYQIVTLPDGTEAAETQWRKV